MTQDMRTGRYTRFIVTLLLLLICGAGEVWADGITVTIDEGIAHGTVAYSVDQTTRVVTLTVTPASGYQTKKDLILVEKMINPDKQSAPRRAPGLGTFELTGGPSGSDPWIYNNSSDADKTFNFTVTSEYDGAYVTVTFVATTPTTATRITSLTEISNNLAGNYELAADVDGSGVSLGEFTGTLDGKYFTIHHLNHPLFASTNNATIRNINFENVNISTDGDAGAITSCAKGATRIYNCGILPTTTEYDADGKVIGFLGSSVGGSGNVGGLVGKLEGTARVINCFSYANITGGTNVAGIVGKNSVASTQSALTTMVMNCMFYGDISNGGTISPIYGGTEISNVEGGMNTYNYYRYRSRYSAEKQITAYNRALAMEEKFITRFERYRLLLNSNKKLAAIYATGSAANASQMAKWVLETADRQILNPLPYPVLKEQGRYPSIINYDAEHAPDSTTIGRLNGGKLGKTLTVHIGRVGDNAPTGARILRRGAIPLPRTDKDTARFNFNYDKVQLPYYNDVGEGNYTGNRVVTGWKITSITGGTPGTYTKDDSWGGYNFADRKCTKKDLYSETGRVFSQGAYWDVPEGVTAITIEPYWAKANYVSDEKYDVVYNSGYSKKDFNLFGTQYSNDKYIDIYGDGHNDQKVYTSIANAIADFETGKTVYDQAVVLVGNVHQYGDPTNGNAPYTLMSIDMNHDNEPDYSYIFSHDNRKQISPIRFDFLNIMGIAEAQIPKGATLLRNVSIFNLKGWFEVTNTCVVNFSQFEYENSNNGIQNAVAKSPSPLILLGGTFEQFVSTQKATNLNEKHTQYIHIGSNAWFAKFGNGTHSDGSGFTPHIPISVTGGDYDEFYLSGTYQPNITNMQSDNAECYINGGRFGEVAGASLEAIKGDVRWDINWADITNFYGGGVNAVNPITGDITIDISNSHVNRFCGGPQFGDMTAGKTVTTNATGCVFGTYFGAGFGGNAYNRVKYKDVQNTEPASHQGEYKNERGKYYDGATTNSGNYGKKGKGVATDFDYEFFVWSSGGTGSRFYVKFVTFSLATTHGVTSNLSKCKVTGNVYGGGSLGKVDGDVITTLNSCEVSGSVFGAGFSATLPTVQVRNTPAFISGKEPTKNMNIGMFEPGEINTTVDYEWKQVASTELTNGGTGMVTEDGKNYVYTDTDLSALGTVTGNVTLNIDGNTTVGGSVYGGGEESAVGGNTTVTVNSGTIGAQGQGGAEYGNVYGGGKGKNDNVLAGLVKGNTNVTISGNTTTIYHNVYGGGAYGSVGDFNYDTDNNITGLETTGSGQATVTILGGTFGWNGQENGMVFGSSRGDVGAPDAIEDRLAWVYSTEVVIGTSGSDAGTQINGSVYGGGENGHNYQNSSVTVHSGTIGIASGDDVVVTNADNSTTTYASYNYPYRGNVYGGGCGTDEYDSDNDGSLDAYNPLAGIVRGNATVTISGGHVVHNVYGAGAMGSVGNAADDTSGKTTVTINGGRLGYDGSRNGNVFGAARGEYGISTAASSLATVRESEVNISSTPTGNNDDKDEALITGSVFGGGEAGLVKGSVTVNMTGGLVLKDVYGGGALADTQTSNWDATNNTWATGKTSESATTTVRLTGGTIRGEAFGGGLGEAGKPAYVYGNVLLDLNGTTTPGGTTGTAIDEKARGCAVGEVFGCNNVNGTPKGTATVHVYATQNASKLQIANKTKDDYDVTAVYGGGNMAAYEPADLANGSTNVIIDGCALTSIKTVYGGGNAASTPATSVTVNGTYEIEEVFGGGNGLDDVVKDGVTKPNPGANVGYKDYSEYYQENNVWKVRDKEDADTKTERLASNYCYGTGKASVNIFGGTIHRVFGGSNTKGNVRETAVTLLEEANSCDFCVDEAYGGGKSAPMDAEAKLLMACIPGLSAAYGGAEAADIQGDVTLNITNGTFDRVFGGNNKSGTISGSITVNISEVGCKPIIIGELYGGGNLAGYSVYGYNSDKSLKETGTQLYSNPQVNVKSFTSIGTIYGGGYGAGATMVGNPTVNIDVVNGAYYNDDKSVIGDDAKTPNDYPIPSHAKGKIGAINNVFGGGNAAMVKGDTHVNIGTSEVVYEVANPAPIADNFASGTYYVLSGEGTPTNPYKYVAAGNTFDADKTYYVEKPVVGVDIRGNVYGGGNNAEVTGNTNVTIGKEAATTSGSTQNP